MHWAAESARWSYWPGRYSTANTVSSLQAASLVTVSNWGSDSTVLNGVVEQLPADALQIIAVEQPQARQGLNAQKCPQVLQQSAGFVGQRLLSFLRILCKPCLPLLPSVFQRFQGALADIVTVEGIVEMNALHHAHRLFQWRFCRSAAVAVTPSTRPPLVSRRSSSRFAPAT